MADEIKLTELITKEQFIRIRSAFDRNFGMPLETTDVDGREIRALCSPNCHPKFCKLIKASRSGAKRCRLDRIRSLRISLETGQPYISFCHAGIVLVCIPIMDQEMPLGGLFFAKCLHEQVDETLWEDINKRLRGLRLNKNELMDAARQLPIVTGRDIHEAAEFLFILLYEICDLDPRVIKWRRQRTEQQSEIGDFIQQSKKIGIGSQYPYKIECELISKVKIGDRTGAREILNSLLGTIMFQNPGQLNVLKARLVELLSILSRAAAEGGVNINLLLEKNLDYINKVLHINTQEDLCAWISNALNDFIESVYSGQDAVKITQIRPATDFIETNYDQQITLADIARSAHLSVSRLAHLFKEQMGITAIDYLTSVRISQAKRLLLATDKNCTEVCFGVGYNNQSYFTRTFKSIVGMTPRQFRERNRRPSDKNRRQTA